MKTVFGSILVLGVLTSFGQANNDKHCIDIELQACLDSSENHTTKGMTDCVHRVTDKWDLELNRNYAILMTLLSDQEKATVKKSQLAWIKFRDEEINFSNQLYYGMGGTMWVPVAAQTKLDLTRQRALKLEAYIQNLTIK